MLISLIHITTKSHVNFSWSVLPPVAMFMIVGYAAGGSHKGPRPMLRTIMMSMYCAEDEGLLMSLVCAAVRDHADVLGMYYCRKCCGWSVL